MRRASQINKESAASQRVQPRARDDKKLPDSTSKKCPSPMESSDQVQPSIPQQPSQQAAPQQQQNQQQAASTTKSAAAAGTQPADDVYEFKNVKETSVATDTKNATEPMDVQSESSDTLTTSGQQPPSDESSPTKRPFSEITDAADDVQPDDENRRKKRKDSDSGKEGKAGQQPARSTGQTGKTANKPGPAAAKSNTLSASKSNSADRKSPCPSPKPSNNPDSEQDDAKSDLKVPPLKIVIPQGSTAEQESGGNRNGKNSSQRTHQALPYVVASLNSNDSADKDTNSGGNTSPTENSASTGKGDEKKDGFTGSSNEEQKSTSGGHHQRVLRSSHRSGVPASSSQTSSTGSGATDRSSNNSSPLLQRSHSPSPNASPAAQPTSGQAQQTENTASSSSSSQTSNSSGTKPTTEAQATTNTDADSNNSTSAAPALQPSASNSNSSSNTGSGGAASVELHPRKRKMRPSKEPTPATSQPHDNNTDTPAVSEVHPHEQPITNCYQLYLNIRKQIERRRKSLFPVQPKPPQGFKDYLMNRCTYVLAGTAPTVPNVTPPANLPHQMKELFTEQEKERYKLRMQHVIEKEKLVLSVEQEILRVHGRAARALANQSLPFSVCTVLRDEEVYNIITPEQEEKDRNARSRYNGRLFLSWLQDVDDKWEKIKESMLLRHHNEAESLHAVQKMEWEWKLKELSLCEFKATPQIDDVHVPMVHVSDDFDLLPA